MANKKLIINIDGPAGIGKTSQIIQIRKYLLDKSLNVSIGDVSLSNLDKMKKSCEDLSLDYDVSVNEGSFLRDLANDFLDGMYREQVLQKHRELLSLNETTRSPHTVLNIILVTDNIEIFIERAKKNAMLLGLSKPNIDAKKEADILTQIIGFENSMNILNVVTKLLYVDTQSSILEVTDSIVDIISPYV